MHHIGLVTIVDKLRFCDFDESLTSISNVKIKDQIIHFAMNPDWLDRLCQHLHNIMKIKNKFKN